LLGKITRLNSEFTKVCLTKEGKIMSLKRPRVPIGLPIAMVITLIIGLAANPLISSITTEEQLARNVLLSAIPFIFIFVSIILAFITVTWLLASMLSQNISERVYRPVEYVIIAGIVLGIIGMFQPWWFAGYRLGFFLLFFSTLAFILWSHIVPRGKYSAHLESVSIGDFEKAESGG
jgi:Na+-transporting NADH:ubiquinone oxidoreductase subunit NqrE